MKGIEFIQDENRIVFVYTGAEYLGFDWVREELKKGYPVTFKNTFTFKESDEVIINHHEYDNHPPIGFLLGTTEGEYYKLRKDVLYTKNNFFIHRDITLKPSFFIAESKISVLYAIDELVNEDIYIGGIANNNISIENYLNMLNNFPTTHEKKVYAQARVSSIIKNYFESTIDAESKFQNYLNKKSSKKGVNLNKIFKEYEIEKYKTIYEKLIGMLEVENHYSEEQWQIEILEIVRLLYPKYIFAFKTVYLNIDHKKRRFLDFMLVDSDGHIDVIEIKKPFEKSVMASTVYRNNYPPHKDLTGTIMQLEKYLYHLNRSGALGEKKLSEKYKAELPTDLNISITNPKGFVIMGRDNNLNNDQKSDFEIVKRKYKNVIDIITYDDLLRRLKFTIEQIKKL